MSKAGGIDTLVPRFLLGQASSTEIETEVSRRWEARDFLGRVDPTRLPAISRDRRRTARYGHRGDMVSEVLFGSPGGPGCTLITTPDEILDDDSLRGFYVPPHVHRSDHVAVVIAGTARFLLVDERMQKTVVVEPVTAGCVLFYPAGTPHTFILDQGSVRVASVDARYTPPDSKAFAVHYNRAIGALARLNYAGYRRRCVA